MLFECTIEELMNGEDDANQQQLIHLLHQIATTLNKNESHGWRQHLREHGIPSALHELSQKYLHTNDYTYTKLMMLLHFMEMQESWSVSSRQNGSGTNTSHSRTHIRQEVRPLLALRHHLQTVLLEASGKVHCK